MRAIKRTLEVKTDRSDAIKLCTIGTIYCLMYKPNFELFLEAISQSRVLGMFIKESEDEGN